jgi:hypothetical protein
MSAQSELEASIKAEAASSAKDLAMQNDTVASIAASVDTAKGVEAEFAYYAQFIPKKFPATLDQGVDWAKTSLTNYAKANAKKWGAETIDKVASAYGYEGYIPDEIPTNEKEAAKALTDIACTAAASELGVDPRIAKVTVEAVMDGDLDKQDAEAIGSLAGSIAGAALCQTFGIPAPIGAFLGGELGGLVGGAIADIFGASDREHEEWLKKQRAIVAKIHADATAACSDIRGGYWKAFDAYVLAAERSWEDMELQAGSQFDIRWFGRTPTPAFLQYVQQAQNSSLGARYKNRISAQSCDVVCADGSILKSSPKPYMFGASSAEITTFTQRCRSNIAKSTSFQAKLALVSSSYGVPKDSCGLDCIADYGCLYPDLSAYTQYPSQGSLLNSPKRVCSAYQALGFDWLQQPPYSNVPASVAAKMAPWRITGCSLPEANKRAIEDTKYRQLWIAWLKGLVAHEEQRISNLNSASVRLFGDLAQTAAMVAVQRKLSDSKTIASLKGLSGTDPAITTATSWVNNGMLIGGLGWLAINSRRR